MGKHCGYACLGSFQLCLILESLHLKGIPLGNANEDDFNWVTPPDIYIQRLSKKTLWKGVGIIGTSGGREEQLISMQFSVVAPFSSQFSIVSQSLLNSQSLFNLYSVLSL